MKILKKSISILCCMAIVLTTLAPTINSHAMVKDANKADRPFVEDEKVIELAKKYSTVPQAIDEDTVFIPLSEEDNINYLAEKNKFSRSKAKKIVEGVDTNSILNNQIGTMSLPHYGNYEDVTGIILKRFIVVSGVSTTCTVVAAINVKTRIYYEIAYNARQFLEVLDTGVTMAESSVWEWNPNTESATIRSDGFLNFNASGNITGVISSSITGSYEKAGFSVGVSVGSEYHVNKFQTIRYSFDPEYPAGIFN